MKKERLSQIRSNQGWKVPLRACFNLHYLLSWSKTLTFQESIHSYVFRKRPDNITHSPTPGVERSAAPKAQIPRCGQVWTGIRSEIRLTLNSKSRVLHRSVQKWRDYLLQSFLQQVFIREFKPLQGTASSWKSPAVGRHSAHSIAIIILAGAAVTPKQDGDKMSYWSSCTEEVERDRRPSPEISDTCSSHTLSQLSVILPCLDLGNAS